MVHLELSQALPWCFGMFLYFGPELKGSFATQAPMGPQATPSSAIRSSRPCRGIWKEQG